jgi:hypothetical protein
MFRYLRISQDISGYIRISFWGELPNVAMLQQPVADSGQAVLTDCSISIKPISLSLVAGELGLLIPTHNLISIGVELKKLYLALQGKDQPKHVQLCNGRVTKVNSYMESDPALMEEILHWYLAGRP